MKKKIMFCMLFLSITFLGFAQQQCNFYGLRYQIPNDWRVASRPTDTEFFGLKAGTLAQLQIIEAKANPKADAAQFLKKNTSISPEKFAEIKAQKLNFSNAHLELYDMPVYSKVTQETFHNRLYICQKDGKNFVLLFSEIIADGKQAISRQDEESIIQSIGGSTHKAE